jgi:hypothetical protein
MGYTIALYSVFIGMAVLAVLLLATFYLCELVNYFKNKRHKKWCAWVFERYPELKVLLSNYHRLRSERGNTVREAVILQKTIDEWVEKNKYLPEGRRVDKHIEVLKEQYQELLDIHAEQGELSDKARAELEDFWKTNFPDLREDKWIMWWSE